LSIVYGDGNGDRLLTIIFSDQRPTRTKKPAGKSGPRWWRRFIHLAQTRSRKETRGQNYPRLSTSWQGLSAFLEKKFDARLCVQIIRWAKSLV